MFLLTLTAPTAHSQPGPAPFLCSLPPALCLCPSFSVVAVCAAAWQEAPGAAGSPNFQPSACGCRQSHTDASIGQMLPDLSAGCLCVKFGRRIVQRRMCLCMQVRYTAVRRQTAAAQADRETQVLDYQNTAFELLPLLSTAYALIFMVTPLLVSKLSSQQGRLCAFKHVQLCAQHCTSMGVPMCSLRGLSSMGLC